MRVSFQAKRPSRSGAASQCPKGSHMSMYDDQATYMDGVVTFIKDVDAGRF